MVLVWNPEPHEQQAVVVHLSHQHQASKTSQPFPFRFLSSPGRCQADSSAAQWYLPVRGIILLYGEVSETFKGPASCFQLFGLTPHSGAHQCVPTACSL